MTDAVRHDGGRPPRRSRAAATPTATRTTSTATAGSTRRPRSTSSPPAARCPGTITDSGDVDPIGGRHGHREQRRPQFDAVTDTNGNYSLLLAAGSYVVTGDRVRLRHGRSSSGVTIVTDQTTDQDFALDALPRFTVTGHVRAVRGRLADRRTPASARSARPSRRRRPNAAGAYSPRAADRRLHAARLGRRLHRAGRGRHQPRRPRTSPRTSRCSASSTTSATAAGPIAVRLGRRRQPDRAVRRRVRRPAPPAVRLRVLRRDVLADLALRERLPELPRRRSRFNFIPIGDPVGVAAERGDLPVLAGPDDRRPELDRLRDGRHEPRTGRSSSSTPSMQVLGSPTHVSLRDQALGGRPDRPAVRPQPGEPG